MSDTTKLAVIEQDLQKNDIDSPDKIPCGFKDCYCFISEDQRFCSPKCEKKEKEQAENMHGDCDCDHPDCVMIPGRDSASIFAQRSLN